MDAPQQWRSENHFLPVISARNNRSVRNGYEEKLTEAREEPACLECYCTKLKCVRIILIINEILVEATGVELFRVLIARKLLIP